MTEEVLKYEIKLATTIGFELFSVSTSPIVILYQLKKTMNIENHIFQKIVNYVNDFFLSKFVLYFNDKQILSAAFYLTFRELDIDVEDKNWVLALSQNLNDVSKIAFVLSQVYKIQKINAEKIHDILHSTFGSNQIVNMTSLFVKNAALQIIGLITR